MKTSIITSNINAEQFCELRDAMQTKILESMKTLDSHDAESIMWYEGCKMDDYFTEWTEILDKDERIGEGIDTIAHKFVLNDDTRADFENAFEQARDAAFEEYIKDLADEICEKYSDVGMEDVSPEVDGEVEGYERIGEDCPVGAHFVGKFNDLYTAIYNYDDSVETVSPNSFAAWIGATAYGERNDVDDGLYSFYYKKIVKKISCDFDFCDLYIQAEGGWDGWFHPVWAKIVKDENGDYIELSLGDQVSNGTSFRDNNGSTPKSWVGNIEVWHRTWGKDDAEAWAEEFNCKPEDFDSDEELFHEVEGRDLDGCFEEAIEEIKQNIIEYAKSEGYDEVEF